MIIHLDSNPHRDNRKCKVLLVGEPIDGRRKGRIVGDSFVSRTRRLSEDEHIFGAQLRCG